MEKSKKLLNVLLACSVAASVSQLPSSANPLSAEEISPTYGIQSQAEDHKCSGDKCSGGSCSGHKCSGDSCSGDK